MTNITKAAQQALEALEEIALAGMSGTGQESEEGMRDWHACQAWKFISIAARALDPLRAALTQRPAAQTEREAWVPYLVDRADGVKGHYAIGRWNPRGYREVWNLHTHRWAAYSDDVMSLEEADSLLRQITIPTVRASLLTPQQATPARPDFEAWWSSDGPNTASPYDAARSAWEAARQQATPESDDDAQIRAIGEGLRSAHDHIEMHRLERSHCKDAERIREGLAAFSAYKKRGDFAATPEPAAWLVSLPDEPELGEWFSEEDMSEKGYTSKPLFTRPAPGVPDGWRNVIAGTLKTDPWDSARVADYNSGWNDCQRKTLRGLERLAAAQAKGAGHE